MPRWISTLATILLLIMIIFSPMLYFQYKDHALLNKVNHTVSGGTAVPTNQLPIMKGVYEYYYTQKTKLISMDIQKTDDSEKEFPEDSRKREEIVKEIQTLLRHHPIFDEQITATLSQSFADSTLISIMTVYETTNIKQVILALEGQNTASFYIEQESGKIIQCSYPSEKQELDQQALELLYQDYLAYVGLDHITDWSMHNQIYESYQLKAQITYVIENHKVVLSLQPLGWQYEYS